jgi:hypothetical protein
VVVSRDLVQGAYEGQVEKSRRSSSNPGRLDLASQRMLLLKDVTVMVVLDEADKMLDLGSPILSEKLFAQTSPTLRYTMLFLPRCPA